MTVSRIAVVGGGVVGAAVARRLGQVVPDATVTLFEKEETLGTHQTGHNSGVVHAGLYYEPGSDKARLCRRGVDLLTAFCEEHAIAQDHCGKVLVALDELERSRLAEIARRARANGVPGIEILDAEGLHAVEPRVSGIAALHSPSTSIVDFAQVARTLGAVAESHGATLRTGTEVIGIAERGVEVIVESRSGPDTDRTAFDLVILCAGLHADRVAELAGDTAAPRIVPFRGEYWQLRPERRDLVHGLVYPVPDPRYPFLGVHITPRIDGEVLVGPNAVLALSREGYRWSDRSWRDLREIARSRGFRRFARRHWRTGLTEVRGSLSKRVFMQRARAYLPELADDDAVPGPSGVRAQALTDAGALVDDFSIHRLGRVVAVRNAPSPAATACLSIAEHIVDRAFAPEVPR